VNGVWTGTGPTAQFMPTEVIRTTESLRYRAGTYFLGVVDGSVVSQRSPDGRLLRWVRGGVEIGLKTQKHILTLAPTRSDKGRAAVQTNARLNAP
jgi:hypothetical protein